MFGKRRKHNISALIYLNFKGSDKAREMLKGAHRADADIILTANILMHIIHRPNIQDVEQLYIASEEARIPKSITFGKHMVPLFQDLLPTISMVAASG